MPLRIVHCGDFHIGAPLRGLSSKKAAQRSSEIRASLSGVADFCREKEVDALIICGDLFDTPEPSASDSDFVRDVLSSLSPIDVFILCGNHDYMCAQSPFAKEGYFSENVHIFPAFEYSFEIPDKNAVFIGKSYSSPVILPSFSQYSLEKDKINIMCLHGDMTEGSTYNTISKETLSSLSPDYAAFGHIHNAELFSQGQIKCAYCGTPEGHSFADNGKTGFIYAEISKDEVNISQICLSLRKYRNVSLDISGMDTPSIIESARGLLDGTDLFKLSLTGTLCENEYLNISAIEKGLQEDVFYIEISDDTVFGYDLDKIENEDSLRGQFLRTLRTLCKSEEEFTDSATLGLDALCGRVPGTGGVL